MPVDIEYQAHEANLNTSGDGLFKSKVDKKIPNVFIPYTNDVSFSVVYNILLKNIFATVLYQHLFSFKFCAKRLNNSR